MRKIVRTFIRQAAIGYKGEVLDGVFYYFLLIALCTMSKKMVMKRIIGPAI